MIRNCLARGPRSSFLTQPLSTYVYTLSSITNLSKRRTDLYFSSRAFIIIDLSCFLVSLTSLTITNILDRRDSTTRRPAFVRILNYFFSKCLSQTDIVESQEHPITHPPSCLPTHYLIVTSSACVMYMIPDKPVNKRDVNVAVTGTSLLAIYFMTSQ